MLSTTTWILLALCLVIVKHAFIVPKQDRDVYRLYEQRDKLALKAMRGELEQEAVEYRFVVKNLNFWIYYTRNDYDFSIVWNNIISADKKMINKIEKLDSKIKKSEVLREAMDIASKQSKRALGVSGIVFDKILLGGIILLCNILLGILEFGADVTHFGKSASDKVSMYLNDSKRIRQEYGEFSSQMIYRG